MHFRLSLSRMQLNCTCIQRPLFVDKFNVFELQSDSVLSDRHNTCVMHTSKGHGHVICIILGMLVISVSARRQCTRCVPLGQFPSL